MKMKYLILIFLTFLSWNVFAESDSFLQLEGAVVWQGRNDQRIPGNTGSEFSLKDLDSDAFDALRLYIGKKWNNRHEGRALFAPLKVEAEGALYSAVQFNGVTFSPGAVKALYKFNSYRLTYAYHFDPINEWQLALGGTAKIRHAEVALTQGNLQSSKKNTGFVPLLNFQAVRPFLEDWKFRFDFDGLAAPQGRAFDVAFFIEKSLLKHYSLLAGYRMVEGGADNDKVYNMAWFHYATVGLRWDF